MALATSCPRCHTSFRVVPDQLKIRRGLVRCGNCRHVFSGIDSLRYIDEPGPAAPPRGDAGVAAAEIARLIADREAALSTPARAASGQDSAFAVSTAAPSAVEVRPDPIGSPLSTGRVPPEVSATSAPNTASAHTATDERAADERAADDRSPDDQSPDDRSADDRPADDRPADDRPADHRAADHRAADDRAERAPGTAPIVGEPTPTRSAPEPWAAPSRDPEDPWVTLPAIDPGTEILSATLRLDDGETGAVARSVPPANEPITLDPFAPSGDGERVADNTEPGSVSALQDAPGGAQIDSVAATDGERGPDPLATPRGDPRDACGPEPRPRRPASLPARRQGAARHIPETGGRHGRP